MLENIKKLSKTRFKRTNFKAFSFFLIFSLLIWVLVQFSKTYEEIIRIPIEYVHVPKDKIISDKPVFLEMKLEESGFRIAWFSLFQKNMELDLSKFRANGEELLFDIQGNSGKIRQQLGINAEDVTFLDETIRIAYKQRAVKTVPVVSNIQLNFRPGYASNDSIKLIPDSIKISGPEKRLDSIKMVKTVSLALKNIDGPQSGSVALDTNGRGQIRFYRNKVDYVLQVEKFTEGTLEIPIHVINAPENMEIVLFPKTLEVVFKVSLRNYGEISKSDFRIVVDYNELEEGQAFFIPKVLKRPEMITNLRLGINKVEFIIRK